MGYRCSVLSVELALSDVDGHLFVTFVTSDTHRVTSLKAEWPGRAVWLWEFFP